jgi:hypothetical protein
MYQISPRDTFQLAVLVMMTLDLKMPACESGASTLADFNGALRRHGLALPRRLAPRTSAQRR